MTRSALPQPRLLALTVAALCAGSAFAQTAPAPADDEGKATVVVTGTRVANRTALDTAAPVDIISQDTIKNMGSTELNQALSVALPSLNFPRPGLTDGTDTVRPAQLRGLSPDQTLVLVNSKRRHAAALVNINGSIGRGSAAVDMNAIPTAIVKSVEVLRDGASAQYGSDALAGVVNVRLRQDKTGGDVTVNWGERWTDYNVLTDPGPADRTWADGPTGRQLHDGRSLTVSGWKGLPLGESGYATVAFEHKDAAHTERGGYDMRQQYAKVAGAYDPREKTINRWNTWYGEPQVKQDTLYVNAGLNLDGGAKLYAWAGYQQREAVSVGFFRRPLDDRNITSIYPDGFLPQIAPKVDDQAAGIGYSWSVGDWDLDTSVVYGDNKMKYTIQNTLNRSIGPTSKTVFDAGGMDYSQTTWDLSAVKQFEVGLASPLNVAVGAEFRDESYKITAGEPDSYRYGGVLLANGTPSAPGSQVFAGFTPTNAGSVSRTAYGAYLDLEGNLTKQFLGSFSVRGEHYSDYGNSLAGKLGGRFDFSKEFALRGAVQNGFRAPSLQQQGFTTTSTNFINGVPFDITTFKPTDPVAVALGAQPLKAEKSVNLSLGAVVRAGGLSLTIDAYQIKIKDRIVLSENLTQANVRAFLTSKGFTGIGGGRFFINGVDTTTRGLDIVSSWGTTNAMGKWDFTAAANFGKTTVDKVPQTAQLAALSPAPILFDHVNVVTMEKGAPKSKLSFSTTWKQGAWSATGRVTRYGDVVSPNAAPLADFVIGAKNVADLEARLDITKQLHLAVGADNIFDTYPDPLPPNLNTTGATSYSNYSPFGRSGRYVYTRLSYNF